MATQSKTIIAKITRNWSRNWMVIKGKTMSPMLMSLENRLRILPTGLESKKETWLRTREWTMSRSESKWTNSSRDCESRLPERRPEQWEGTHSYSKIWAGRLALADPYSELFWDEEVKEGRKEWSHQNERYRETATRVGGEFAEITTPNWPLLLLFCDNEIVSLRSHKRRLYLAALEVSSFGYLSFSWISSSFDSSSLILHKLSSFYILS